jgi:capsular polysaccharide biosynthesis protein
MRTEHEPRRAVAHSLPDLDEEREIDFARLGRTVLSRWWLVAAAVALGALIGYLTSLGGGDVYVARTTVYLGQPLSPTGGSQIPSVATHPTTVSEIVRSEDVVQDVAQEVGIRPGELRRGISTQTLTSSGSAQRLPQNPLVQISVRGPWSDEAAQAANLLAAAVIREVSGYVDAKVGSFEEQLRAQNRELGQIDRRLGALQGAAEGGGLSSVERLTLLSLIGFAEQRRGQLLDERTSTRQLITLAETVERSKQVTEARSARVPAQSARSAMVVGGLIGLLVGLALALLWNPVLGRRRLST